MKPHSVWLLELNLQRAKFWVCETCGVHTPIRISSAYYLKYSNFHSIAPCRLSCSLLKKAMETHELGEATKKSPIEGILGGTQRDVFLRSSHQCKRCGMRIIRLTESHASFLLPVDSQTIMTCQQLAMRKALG